jgi:hypothetical protein
LQSELPRFYLRSEHLLLHPDQIFMDAEGSSMTFCYEPLWQQEPRRSLQELLEQLLPQVDHQDKEAVKLIYGLYEVCQRENADVWGYVMEYGSQGTCRTQPAVSDTPTERQTEKAECSSRLSKPEQTPTVSALAWLQSLELGKKKKEERPQPLYLFEPDEKPQESAYATACLTAMEHPEGRLVYQGSGMEDSFVLDGETFLVGGRNGHADGQLKASGVSRNHARITREEHDYYIEDLNSKNGTYLNGELLPYRQRYRMKPGDHVMFAREEYVFY